MSFFLKEKEKQMYNFVQMLIYFYAIVNVLLKYFSQPLCAIVHLIDGKTFSLYGKNSYPHIINM